MKAPALARRALALALLAAAAPSRAAAPAPPPAAAPAAAAPSRAAAPEPPPAAAPAAAAPSRAAAPEPPPAAAPTAAPDPSPLSLSAQLAAGFDARFAAGEAWTRFDLARAELGLGWLPAGPGAGAALQLDVVRSAGPDSLIGVAGDALVAVLARAYGRYALDAGGAGRFTVSLGLVPHPWVTAAEGAYALRAVAPLAADGLGLVHRSDLGAVVSWSALAGRLGVDLAVLNGEGARQLELDRAKDLDAVVRLGAWRGRWLGEPLALDVALGVQRGTSGAASVPNLRGLATIALSHSRVGAGVEGVLAEGHEERADRALRAFAAWVRGEPIARRLGLFARYELARLDIDVAASDRAILDVGAYTDLGGAEGAPLRLRLYAGYRAERYGEAAGSVAGAPGASDLDAFWLRVEALAVTRP